MIILTVFSHIQMVLQTVIHHSQQTFQGVQQQEVHPVVICTFFAVVFHRKDLQGCHPDDVRQAVDLVSYKLAFEEHRKVGVHTLRHQVNFGYQNSHRDSCNMRMGNDKDQHTTTKDSQQQTTDPNPL